MDPRLTYPEVGATLEPPLPTGYGRLRRTHVVGRGRERFEQAARTLLTWGMHRGAGVRVSATSPEVAPDVEAVLRLGPGPLSVAAPVRVVRVVDEPRRQGFAYGTLPGHPERGEEAFVLDLAEDGTVTFTITAFSRPATRLARLGGPVTRLVQSWVTERYLRAV